MEVKNEYGQVLEVEKIPELTVRQYSELLKKGSVEVGKTSWSSFS